MSRTYEHILCDVSEGIMQITLNRPDKLNAYTAIMGAELADAFDRADGDDAVRVVLVTGAGRGFCAGADMSAGAGAFDTTSAEGSAAFGDVSKAGRSGGSGMVGAVYECRKPSIAAFNGSAVGVGLTLTLPMDIRIAATTARFGFVFARRGLVPEAGSAWFLPRLVGVSQALRWCLDGALFSAEEALKGGLVSEVTSPEDLLPRARAIARSIADNTAPVSVALTRQMLWRLSEAATPYDTLKVDGPLAMALGTGADVREGVAAFLEKRPPAFTGKVSTDMPRGYPWWSR
ncbi:enoyl-CoA hydratase-related protein [Phenylobacterium sp.]|uniref:enoyl-CoA hydratase-related protein n=1 Tax=Phenylobacterium sp. TaxID=1871053 RepID=UPI003BA84929